MSESKFLSPLRFQDDGGLPFTLLEPLIYASKLLQVVVIVRSGFKTDLASIPRGLWNVLPPVGRYDRAAVVHDKLYQQPEGVTRGEADAVLREAMEVEGVSTWQCRLIYLGVRLGGWAVWRRYRQESR